MLRIAFFIYLLALLSAYTYSAMCPDRRIWCRSTNTCCELQSGGYACCPYEMATCCSDGLHCCPHQTTCDMVHRTCQSSDPVLTVVLLDWNATGGQNKQAVRYDYITVSNEPVPLTNKIWKKCELARELLKKHGYPRSDLPDWMCTVRWESSFNSAQIHHNSDKHNSTDYGIFQINDYYWCGGKGKSNSCGIDCQELMTEDITASASCAMKVFLDRKHWDKTHIGFRAWNGWILHCSNGRAKSSDLDECILDLDGHWIGKSHNTDGFHSSVQLECDSTWDNQAKCKVYYPDYPCTGYWTYQGVAPNGTIMFHESIGHCFAVQLVATVSADSLEFQGYLPAEPHVIVYGSLTRRTTYD